VLGHAAGVKEMGRGALNIAKLCAYASVGRTTVFAEIKAGRLIAHKLGRSTIIFVEDADAWLEALPRVRPSAPDSVVSTPPCPFEAKPGGPLKSSVPVPGRSPSARRPTSWPRDPPQKAG